MDHEQSGRGPDEAYGLAREREGGAVRLPDAGSLAAGVAAVERAPRPRDALGTLLASLGDGEFHAALRTIENRDWMTPTLLVDDVESVASDMARIVTELDGWDEDDAWDVQQAALKFLKACERFCRNKIEAGV